MFSSYYMSLTGHVSPNKMHETDVAVVVISPEDREQVERLARAYEATWTYGAKSSESTVGVIVRQLQAALRSLIADPTPPKPDEPSTYGVVEAACVHSDLRRPWMRDLDGNWWPSGPYDRSDSKPERFPDDWDSLIDPVVVREGVR